MEPGFFVIISVIINRVISLLTDLKTEVLIIPAG